MSAFSLIGLLRWKVIWVLLAFTFALIGYFHFLSLRTENERNIRRGGQIAAFLAQRAPPALLAAPAAADGEAQPDLQALLDAFYPPSEFVRYGYYSRRGGRIVAFGPERDSLMLAQIDAARLRAIHDSEGELLLEEDHSLFWYGASAFTCAQPIYDGEEIVGHAFASVNRDRAAAHVVRRTLIASCGAVFMLMGCIMVHCELFGRFRRELRAYAESIVKGEVRDYRARVPELKPFLDYISAQTKKMTRLDRLNIVGEMAAGIAHEVRNPLTTVRGLLQILSDKDALQAYRGKFELMIGELDSANAVITEFLSLAKDQAMRFEPADLNQIIRGMEPLWRANALQLRADLKVVLDLQPLPAVPLDAASIHRLLCNLVVNAFEAMPEGGAVYVRTAPAENGVRLSVEDEGCGIPEKLLDKIGTPFLTTKDTGVGLGLAICNRIALRHQARFRIRNNAKKGAAFTLLFPLRRKEVAPERRKPWERY